MKKKISIAIGIFVIILIIAGIITNYVDSGRVMTGNEPKYCIKIVSNDGNKVTYWGLGYKVVRYVEISPNEPYENNIGVKMGNWFMKYELPKADIIKIEYEGQTVTVTDIKDIKIIKNILLNSKYDGEICNGINTHKITINNEIYYLKESCQEIQKGNKQAQISKEDLETINNIIFNKKSSEKNNEEQFFFGKVIQSNTNYIIVEPNENEEIRKSSDKINVGLGENNDAIYEEGTNVKITYEGSVMESYPAKVNATKIEIKSVDKFNIVFYQKTAIKPKQKEIIISKNEVKGVDYNVYAFEGNIAINFNSDSQELTENSISLREALLQNKITVNEIIEKANKDLKENTITGNMYKDGGSMIYQYNNYTIIKCHTVNENRDLYIGAKDMTINDLEI